MLKVKIKCVCGTVHEIAPIDKFVCPRCSAETHVPMTKLKIVEAEKQLQEEKRFKILSNDARNK
jgi:hypothetical protein